ncbi:hypothetical protein L1987_04508 [Smallanthus sonchifolius]|uniref:Uncharacterized protein n=1 Tax=Smallanthus sonchifolius TaxID=185202 RepID=A0ACB9JSY6_9ASTR|nr:hypothetical protein L1987_04508 [Smallanthus sonchifolius]
MPTGVIRNSHPRLLRRRPTRPAGKKPDPSHETAPNKKPSKLYERRSSLKNFRNSPLVPRFTNAAGFSGSPRNSNPLEILSLSLLDFPSRALSPVVCARCHSLRNFRKVKDQTVENLLPDFDHTVGRRLNSVTCTQSMSILELGKRGNQGIFLI